MGVTENVMKDFDVIVIGGGPAGCYAALAAATRGCIVAVFEEHGAIGWPRHDPGWLMDSRFTESVISAVGRVVPWIKVSEFKVCNSEHGGLVEKSALGGYLVRRDLLEKEIAALAVRAGVRLYLRTRVTNLVKKGGRIEEIETNSSIIPSARGKIVICADGIKSSATGLAVKEGLCKRGEVVRAGISYLLANAKVSPGIIELFLSSDPVLNYRCFFTHLNETCFLSVPSSEVFNELKERVDNVVSTKIKNAYALEVSGFAAASSGKYGQYFENIVGDNILFVGDASGGAGNIHGMIQGHFAGSVAASAIKDNDINQDRLREYQYLVVNTVGRAPFVYFSVREEFGSFNDWFGEFKESTMKVNATEFTHFQ